MGKNKLSLIHVRGIAYWVEKFPFRKQWALIKIQDSGWELVAYFRREEEALAFRRYLEAVTTGIDAVTKYEEAAE